MHATKARDLAETSLKGPAIEAPMADLYEKIERAAREGLRGLKLDLTPYPYNVHQAVRDELRAQGYEVRNNPDPDPGHPCSRGGWESIHW